jgi:hypothetical protein
VNAIVAKLPSPSCLPNTDRGRDTYCYAPPGTGVQNSTGKIAAMVSHQKRIEQLEERVLGPKHWRDRAWDWFEKFTVIVGFPSSIASLLILYWPQVNINLDKTLNRSDAFATQFAVVNGSNFSLRHVEFTCVSSLTKTNIGNNRTEPELPVEELNAGDTLSRGCGVVTINVPADATLDVTVTYSYRLLGRRHVTVHFEARRDAQGVPQWFKTIETSARLSSQ